MDNRNESTISSDKGNNAHVDAGFPRQDTANRMAEQQMSIPPNFAGGVQMAGAKGRIFRKTIVYMTIFGIVFSVLGWGLGEIPQREKNKKIVEAFEEIYDNSGSETLRRRPEISEEEAIEIVKDTAIMSSRFDMVQGIIVIVCLAVGFSIAEGFVGRNSHSALINGVIGTVLGCIGYFAATLFSRLLGDLQGLFVPDWKLNSTSSSRLSFFIYFSFRFLIIGVRTGFLGVCLGIIPGIVMRSRKKIKLGLFAGLIGGMFAGLIGVFARAFASLILSRYYYDYHFLLRLTHPCWALVRLAEIFGLGVGIAVATAILESIAKRGWLRVATGAIEGKQFILYRDSTVIGSSPRSDIRLCRDASVAPRHAVISRQNGAFILSGAAPVQFSNNEQIGARKTESGDQIQIGQPVFILTSPAPVLVNNNVLVKPQELKSGDRIQIGQTILIFGEKARKKR